MHYVRTAEHCVQQGSGAVRCVVQVPQLSAVLLVAAALAHTPARWCWQGC
jgi:hypothetical protein